jgi:hypothetical protein
MQRGQNVPDESGSQPDERRLPLPGVFDPVESVVMETETQVKSEMDILADEGILAGKRERRDLPSTTA